MDNLRCNRLTCRKLLSEKAVVTTCSHIFCVECANELFNASRLCPACDTSLTEPDDVVVCSLHPSNDYKTVGVCVRQDDHHRDMREGSLLPVNCIYALNIAFALVRALSFWQYQVHQEHSFQQAVIRNVNEKNAQMQKELNNVVREANGEISLLNNKITELQRDLELERRKAVTLQESLKEREKEYQKLKSQHDKIKRRSAMTMPGGLAQEAIANGTARGFAVPADPNPARGPAGIAAPGGGTVDVNAVVGGMEASGIQRTPISNRTMQQGPGHSWRAPSNVSGQPRHTFQRQPFNASAPGDRSFRSNTTLSEGSDSANEVENLLGNLNRRPSTNAGAPTATWSVPRGQRTRAGQRVFVPPSAARPSGGFRPAAM